MIIGNPLLLKKADDSTPADPVTRSLRFDGSSSKLTRTPSSASSATACTISFWVKRGKTDEENTVFHAGTASGDRGHVRFNSNNTLEAACYNGSWFVELKTNAVYRDPGAFYHIFVSIDTTNGTGKLFVNGEEPSLQTNTTNSSSTVLPFGKTIEHQIGQRGFDSTGYHDGLVSDFYFIDGTALSTPVGNLIEDTGYSSYKPKAFDMSSYSGNSFHIDAQPAHDADLLVSSIARNDGDTDFADAAAGHTITDNGDPEHSIAVGNPFTGDDRAIVFNPSNNDMLEIASSSDFQFGTGDFTIEGWYNFRHLTGDQVICDLRPSNTSDSTRPSFSTAGAGLKMHFAGGNTTLASSGLVIGKWHHIEISRSSNTLYCFIDGTQTYSNTFSNDLNTDCTPHLGSTDTNSQVAFLDGYVFDYHILKGFGRNTSNFTVPTEKSTKDSTYTVLLLQPDKDDTGFDDLSDSGHTITATGSPTRTASTPYDAAAKSTAMYFDGSGDYLNIGTTSDFRTTTNNFTLDFWFKPNGSSTGTVFSNVNDGNVYDGLTANVSSVIVSVSLRDSSSSNNVVSLTYTNDDTDWHHVEVSRTGSTLYLFVDGNLEDSGSISFTPTNSGLVARAGRVYASSYSGSNNYEGYLFDYRWSNSGGHTASFTAPSAPLELNPVYIGGDQSGNKNHFTPTNISSHDVMLDVPYPKNYATLNPLQKAGTEGDDPTEGNLSLTGGSNPSKAFSSTIAVNSGKYYAEFYIQSLGYPTVAVGDTSLWVDGYGSGRIQGNGVVAYDIRAASTNGQYFINSTSSSSNVGITPATDDIIQVAFDADTRKVWFGRNGTWNGSGDPANGTNHVGVVNGTDALAVLLRSEVHSSAGTTVANYGQDPTFAGGASSRSDSPDTSQGEFYYAPPTGFKSLNTSNLAAPTVTPEENFNIALYEGDSTAGKEIDTVGFEPDLIWTKARHTNGTSHKVYDSLRGNTKKLETDNATEEGTVTDLNSFGIASNDLGFTLNSGNGSNYTGRDYVAWNWKAHQSPSDTRTTYTVKVEDASGDAWDASSSFYDSSTYLPNVYMELWENRSSGLVSLGKVAVRSLDESGNSVSDLSEQTYELKCVDLNAITVKWHYDTSGDGQEYDYPNSYNDYLNEQKITILDGSTSEWTTNNHSNDDGGTNYNYSPPSGWANGDSLKSATTSYTGSDTATLTSGSGPVEKYNASAGFTMIKYAGDGSTDGDTQTLDHSLGVPLEFVIVKGRTNNDSMDSGEWVVWHKDLTSGNFLRLNSNAAQDSESSSNTLIATATSGSQHRVVVNNGYANTSGNAHYLNSGPDNGTGDDYILYGWAGVEGMVKVGSWVGNGDDDGPMVYCGFRPSLILAKAVDRSNSWYMWDDQRDGYNVTDAGLWADLSGAESHASTNKVDFLSTGFKLRGDGNGTNSSSSNNYVFIAWAHSPFSKANSY